MAACGLQASHVPPSRPPLLRGEARLCGRVRRGGSCRRPPCRGGGERVGVGGWVFSVTKRRGGGRPGLRERREQ